MAIPIPIPSSSSQHQHTPFSFTPFLYIIFNSVLVYFFFLSYFLYRCMWFSNITWLAKKTQYTQLIFTHGGLGNVAFLISTASTPHLPLASDLGSSND
ncbi:hypothetical protein CROQUDRAFT_387321 [Cronartium quercuum f. sp. fusiforme G11]|uniref:Transmembrane protein n=1 Tax=Cronartium quercuum f. sp. fusiforme G11 TaxID=708437 RepID=A0A9P6NR55_9BASI|nr:hypothetical protein CROQUDRAFT_387321 [Cronartium quercuum f. sp. fusiforme G11]